MEHVLEVHGKPITRISRDPSAKVTAKFPPNTCAFDGHVHEETPTKVLSISLDSTSIKLLVTFASLM